MSITIAAICSGITVDDTIQWARRITEEFVKDRDYWAAVKHSHKTIDRAMYQATMTITPGFPSWHCQISSPPAISAG